MLHKTVGYKRGRIQKGWKLKMEIATNTDKLQFDKEIQISTGLSKTSTSWKHKTMMYSELVKQLSTTTKTRETTAQYKTMNKIDRDRAKDVGGFVGGLLKNGRRKAENVQNRSIISLDMDLVTSPDIWKDIQTNYDFACCIYSTHSHTPEAQRLRLIIPLLDPVFPDQYQAISRMLAYDLGIDQFDDSTYEPFRLMYWPSTTADGEFFFRIQDKKLLDPQTILSKYTFGWEDQTHWPVSSRAEIKIRSDITKQQDPTTKAGIIGAFCRTYDVPAAIEEFLSGIYEAGAGDRYTYVGGSTFGGMIIYDNLYSYSHHATDPTSMMLCNAWDLIRIHKFGDKSEKASNEAMTELANNDKNVISQKSSEMQADFDAVVDPDKWENSMIRIKGVIKSCPKNFLLIMANDPELKDKFKMNDFSLRLGIVGQLYWRKPGDLKDWGSGDESGLRVYISDRWGIDKKLYSDDAFAVVIRKNSFNPVKDYFESLTWDGVKRVDNLMIDYFGSADVEYNKFTIRKWLVAGVTRIYEPGKKFDNMIILSGATDIGKSSFFSNLAGPEWFTDSLKAGDDKIVMEVMTGKLIAEFGELAGMRKADAEVIKHFLTKTEFNARMAYEKYATRHPIQWLYAGTTNSIEFLKDKTGNRRFWPIDVFKGSKDMWTDLIQERDQIWAEACHLYAAGEDINLTAAEKLLAATEQETHMEIDELEQILEDRMAWEAPKADWKEYKHTEIVSSLNLDSKLKGYAKQNLRTILAKKGIEKHKKTNGSFYEMPPLLKTEQLTDFDPIF